MQIDSPTADAWTMDERAAVLAAAPSVSAAIQNARAQARVTDALERTESVEQRLAAARSLVDAARGAVLHGDRAELERQLARIDAMLSGEVSVMKMLRLPQQRETEATTPVAH
jgi:GAF domain-containing protein